MLSIGGDNLQFYLNFAQLSTLEGMNLDHDFVQVSKLNEDQKRIGLHQKMEHFFSPNSGEDQKKKGLHQKWYTFFPQIQVKTKKKVLTKHGTLFSPNSSGLLPSDAHQSQIIGGMQDVDHTQTIRGIQSSYWGDIHPHPPRVSAPLLGREA